MMASGIAHVCAWAILWAIMPEPRETTTMQRTTYLVSEIDFDECATSDNETATGVTFDRTATARISNPDRENGYNENCGPLSWLNSARIVADVDNDEVIALVSVGDPRGAFSVTFRRLPDGRILIHLPTPGEGMPHLDTRELHPGTLEICTRVVDTSESGARVESLVSMDFSDDEPDTIECSECGEDLPLDGRTRGTLLYCDSCEDYTTDTEAQP